MRAAVFVIVAFAGWPACTSPVAPSATAPDRIDVLSYLVGSPETWPRRGDQAQHQLVDTMRQEVCWTKYANPAMFECWRWDNEWVYHVIDHGLDGGKGGSYRFTDGRWLPRWLPSDGWSLDVRDNRIRPFDLTCREEADRSFPYRLRASLVPNMDAGGDLGVRDTLVLEYRPYDPENAGVGVAEQFYFAEGAGWFLWTRAGARVAFNRRGGPAVPALRTFCYW